MCCIPERSENVLRVSPNAGDWPAQTPEETGETANLPFGFNVGPGNLLKRLDPDGFDDQGHTGRPTRHMDRGGPLQFRARQFGSGMSAAFAILPPTVRKGSKFCMAHGRKMLACRAGRNASANACLLHPEAIARFACSKGRRGNESRLGFSSAMERAHGIRVKYDGTIRHAPAV